MISVEQVMLKLVELNKKGRASLFKRGVVVTEDTTTEERMNKIEEIPIYRFLPTIKCETVIAAKVYKHKIETDLQSLDGGISVTTEINVEKGE